MDEKNQKNGVKFNSADIAKKENPDYFSGRVKEGKLSYFKKFILEGENKFVIIGIASAILLLAVLLCLWLTVWRNNPVTNQSTGDGNAWTQELVNINGEAYSILSNPASESAYSEAIEYYDGVIETTEDKNHQFDLIIARANFMTFNGGKGGATSAIIGITEIDENSLTDEQKYQLYQTFQSAYLKLEQDSTAQEYTDKINALPKDVTTQGGSADE